MDQMISDLNQVVRLRSYKQTYSAWKYEPLVCEVCQAIVLPQTAQTLDHDLKHVFHHPLMIFNGGVYTAAGEIIEESLHQGMLGLRHIPDTADLAEPECCLEGTWLYGGFLFRHIGHMMTESIGRLWALREASGATPYKGVVFITMNGFPPVNSPLAEWLKQSAGVTERSTQTRQMLELFGVDMPVHLVGPATRVERLVVPSQLMGLLPYGDLMEGHVKYREGVWARVAEFVRPDLEVDKRRVYVSRARFLKPTSASIFGEAALDEYFQAHGYDVIYPETMSLRDQIERYASASHIVLAAGSAAHVAALAMNGTQDVVLLKRFPGQKDQFGPQLLAMGASRVTTVDVLAGRFLPLDDQERREFAEPAPGGIYSIDFSGLWSRLAELDFVDGPLEETMQHEIDAQVPLVAQKLAERYGKVFGIIPLEASVR